ncbi:MAG: mechanosensitive ion channel family protein [bacterium]|nr:mechanosensitive ion channel family protein [bacterium]
MNVQEVWTATAAVLVAFGLKVVGAIVVWMLGRWLIGLAVRLLSRALTRQHVDPTIMRWVGNVITVALNIILVVAILGYFGVETTSFAALVAGIGVAIGAAWGGLLSNLAAGTFLITLRPFKVGDYVSAGGVEGTVMEIGLFATHINTPDNVVTLVGNAKIFSDTIQNYSANPYRRVDRTAQIAHGVDVQDAIRRLQEALAKIPNVVTSPGPDVSVIDFTPMGPVLAVRPYTHTDHYWQVYFDTNRTIVDTFGGAGYPVPETHYRFHQTT